MITERLDDANLISWTSTIDNRFSVFIIYPNHPAFKQLKGIYFKVFGVGFLNFDTMAIFIDGEEISKEGYTVDHMYAIEAHEIAHYILNHDIKTPSKEQEKEADIVAIEILNYLNHQKAKDLLIRRFEGLYTSDYSLNNNLSKEDIKKVKTYLKRKKVSLLDKIKKIFRFNKK
jgi:hypothetical protein